MNWLNETAFSIFGQAVKWTDMVGNLLGLAALALGWRRSTWSWPVQLLSAVVLIGAYLSAHLTGLIGKQGIVIVAAVWGWTQWQRGRRSTGEIEVRFATARERAALIGGTALATVAVAGIFLAYPSLSWSPWADAYIFVGTLAAMVAQARGWVEFWFAWIAVDLVGVPLAFAAWLHLLRSHLRHLLRAGAARPARLVAAHPHPRPAKAAVLQGVSA